MAIITTQDFVSSYLEHFGVKGMKWGVRNDKGHEGERVKTKKLAKLDKKWDKDMGRYAYAKLHNAAADKMNNGGVQAINNKPEYRDVNFKDPKNAALYDRYLEEHHRAFESAMVEAGPSLGMNPSGTKRFEIRKNEHGEDDVFLVEIDKDKVKHAVGDISSRIRLTTDAEGVVTAFSVEEVELEHHGIKGMKWGVRKDGKKSPRLPASEDAQRVAGHKTKISKKGGTAALSNKELQEVVARMNLEQQYANLNARANPPSAAKKFVKTMLGQAASQEINALTRGQEGPLLKEYQKAKKKVAK